jgi:hypothetical protein
MYTSYFIVVKPYEDPSANEWEIFNEVCVLLVSYILMFLSLYNDDIDSRVKIGWTYITVVSFNIACNAYKIFRTLMVESLPTMYQNCKKRKEDYFD